MVIQGYDDFFKMYNKQNNKKVKDIVENIVEVLLLLVATFFLFKGIFMTARISNDTSLKQIVASEVTFFVSLVAILIIYICNNTYTSNIIFYTNDSWNNWLLYELNMGNANFKAINYINFFRINCTTYIIS